MCCSIHQHSLHSKYYTYQGYLINTAKGEITPLFEAQLFLVLDTVNAKVLREFFEDVFGQSESPVPPQSPAIEAAIIIVSHPHLTPMLLKKEIGPTH
jgi:hypothetical protein